MASSDMAGAPANSIWTAMGYVPPRGKCNHGSLLKTCGCLRFMLHPLKAATSFDCDGCNHHASLHAMDNPEEVAVVERWKAGEAEAGSGTNRATKRKRIEAAQDHVAEIVELATAPAMNHVQTTTQRRRP